MSPKPRIGSSLARKDWSQGADRPYCGPCAQHAAIAAEGATALYLSGSRARGDHRPDSDVDSIIDCDPSKRFNLLDLVGIKLMIDEALGGTCYRALPSELFCYDHRR